MKLIHFLILTNQKKKKKKIGEGFRDFLLSRLQDRSPCQYTKHFTRHDQVTHLCRIQVVPSIANSAINMIPEPHFYLVRLHSSACWQLCYKRVTFFEIYFRSCSKVMEWLINLLDGWSRGSTGSCTTSSREATRHTLWHTTRHTTGTLVQLSDDGVAHLLQLLLLMLIFILLSSLWNKNIPLLLQQTVFLSKKVHHFWIS